MEGKYYIVTAKCGHVGQGRYIPIEFSVMASSAKRAAARVRYFTRVKHNHKDAIIAVRACTLEEYELVRDSNRYDPYLNCTSKHEQRLIPNLEERMLVDPHKIDKVYKNDRKSKNKILARTYRIMEREAKEEQSFAINNYDATKEYIDYE